MNTNLVTSLILSSNAIRKDIHVVHQQSTMTNWKSVRRHGSCVLSIFSLSLFLRFSRIMVSRRREQLDIVYKCMNKLASMCESIDRQTTKGRREKQAREKVEERKRQKDKWIFEWLEVTIIEKLLNYSIRDASIQRLDSVNLLIHLSYSHCL